MLYSNHKGAPLTDTEIDENFRHINHRLEKLERCDFPQLGLTEITAQGDRLIFKGPGNVILGEARLPVISPTFRGAWKPQVHYCVQDWVHYQGKLYVCHQNHQEHVFNAHYWISVEENETPRGQ